MCDRPNENDFINFSVLFERPHSTPRMWFRVWIKETRHRREENYDGLEDVTDNWAKQRSGSERRMMTIDNGSYFQSALSWHPLARPSNAFGVRYRNFHFHNLKGGDCRGSDDGRSNLSGRIGANHSWFETITGGCTLFDRWQKAISFHFCWLSCGSGIHTDAGAAWNNSLINVRKRKPTLSLLHIVPIETSSSSTSWIRHAI